MSSRNLRRCAFTGVNIGKLEGALTYFKVSRNNLTRFPSSFSQLKQLKELDARNNSLTSLPAWNELERLNDLMVAGNPLCSNGWVGSGNVKQLMEKEGKGCTPQCSDMCLDASLDNLGCDYKCNTWECNYDNGQCIG